jgi:ribosomal protein L10
MKRPTLGVLKTPTGSAVIKNKTIARALEDAQVVARQAGELRDRLHRTEGELRTTRENLAALQNHWWTRFGELFGIVKVSW